MLRLLAILLLAANIRGEDIDIAGPAHQYWQRPPQDRFSKLKADLESGRIVLDRSSELAFLRSFLDLLEIPVASQMLVFSTTSLQLSLISPRNPRALYFNEDTYVGFIPGGKLEIISLDPELGGIFYIMDIPRRPELGLTPERSTRCMNCHSGSESRYVPGIVIKSVVPGPTGGSLDAFRSDDTGHAIPLSERFGGWYLTGAESFTNHWANIMGRMVSGAIVRTELPFGERFNLDRYPVRTSDLLAHLLHEHQAGFVNRTVEAAYRTREALHAGKHPATGAALQKLARELVRYILFADEAPLPAGGVKGDMEFKNSFVKNRRADDRGRSLKDFDLEHRLFKHRCSYMIYTPLFQNLVPAFKDLVYATLRNALIGADSDFRYLGDEERKAIRSILNSTLADKTFKF